MPEEKTRKRMVVEEVGFASEKTNPESLSPEPVEEIKEKVEELQTLTEDISESVEKSADIQEDLAKAAEEVISFEKTEKLHNQPQETSMPQAPQIKPSRGVNPLTIIIPGIFLLGALLGGIAFYQKEVSQENSEPTPTPNYNNTVTPSPTTIPEVKLDLTEYPINVMNGSGTPGLAGTVKEQLEDAGFKVDKTGNAPSYDYTKTVIKAKVDVPEDFITKLSESLGKNYEVDTKQSLATSSADSVQVIIGSTKAK
jgi:hypothetical protein